MILRGRQSKSEKLVLYECPRLLLVVSVFPPKVKKLALIHPLSKLKSRHILA